MSSSFICCRGRRRNLKVALVTFIVAFGLYTYSVYTAEIRTADRDDLIDSQEQICIHPKLRQDDEFISKHFWKVPKISCAAEENWVYVQNGTFRISQVAVKKHGKIECEYIPLVRVDDYKTTGGDAIKPMTDGRPIASDFFKVACIANDGKKYANLHAGIAYKSDLHARSRHIALPYNAMGYDVLMFGFDSVSHMTWLRMLKETNDFMTKIGIHVLEGYNIVGDGTPQALLPILTGKTEAELPEARKGHVSATTVDGHPWIWNAFKKIGYVTQWVEDMAAIGTFQYRMLGFKNQPTDHNMRPFYMIAEPTYNTRKPKCFGSVPRHVSLLNWLKDTFLMYGKKRKFIFGFHSECSHGSNVELQQVDKDLKEFLEFLYKNNYLNRTILILMSDHGARFGKFRASEQGKLEERMPYFAFRFPDEFKEKYFDAYKNFVTNTQRLVTPFDIHETFMDIINYSGAGMGNRKNRGISLFKEIPKRRSCDDAGVEPHWCACQNWQKVTNDAETQSVANEVIAAINKMTDAYRSKCEVLKVITINKSSKYKINDALLKFKQSSDTDGRKADLSDNMQATTEMYQVTFLVEPGNGLFEASVKKHLKNNTFTINDKEISRINQYGDAPHCIREEFPQLRPYCYCKQQL